MIAHLALFAALTAALPRGSIHGRIVYDGPPPDRARIEATVNADVCGRAQPIESEQIIVAPDAGLANTVVALVGITERAPPPRTAGLKQKNCVFSPHVQSVTAGSELVIGNDDPVIHNVHATIGDATVFNLGMPLRGVNVRRRLEAPGVTAIRCDSGHTWMSAYVVVVPHSYHATTDAHGVFEIPDVLPGRYTLRAWHERLGVRDAEVIVEAGADASVELALGPRGGRVDSRAVAPLEFASAKMVEIVSSRTESPAAPVASSSEDSLLAARRMERAVALADGRDLFRRRCAPCHGDAGDGRGEAAFHLGSRPRDFTRDDLELRSTRSGDLPLADDVFRTISAGIPGTDMPPWGGVLSVHDRRVLARYVLALSDRFISGRAGAAIEIPVAPANDAASIARGRKAYVRSQCAQCHGTRGRADGVSGARAPDLARGVYKSGREPRDLYRTLVTGLSGTPMPAFGDVLGPEETWDVVHYVLSLKERSPIRDLLGVP